MQELVSVIVPVYNVEPYLQECVDSIINQTYENIEILLIDDGSTDGSGSICDEYSLIDNRIRVFHKENGGLSSARNVGIEAASGEYICFVDSDDCIKLNFVETLLSCCLKGFKMAICDYECFQKAADATISKCNKSADCYVVDISMAVAGLYDLISNDYVKTVIAMNKMYHASLFNDISYPLKRLHEDEFVIYNLLMQCDRVCFVNEPLYLYRKRDDSITGNKNALNIDHLDVIDAYEIRIMEAFEYGDLETAEITIRNCLLKLIQFAKEFKEFRDIVDIVRKRYLMIYYKYGYVMNRSRRLKYWALKFSI